MNRCMVVSASLWVLAAGAAWAEVSSAVQQEARGLNVSVPQPDGNLAPCNVGQWVPTLEAARERIFRSLQAKIAQGDYNLTADLTALEKLAGASRRLLAATEASGAAQSQTAAWLKANMALADVWAAALKGQGFRDNNSLADLESLRSRLETLDPTLAARVRNLERAANDPQLTEKWRQRAEWIRRDSFQRAPQVQGIARFSFQLGTQQAKQGDRVQVILGYVVGTVSPQPRVTIDVSLQAFSVSAAGGAAAGAGTSIVCAPGTMVGSDRHMRFDTAALKPGKYCVWAHATTIGRDGKATTLKDFDFLTIEGGPAPPPPPPLVTNPQIEKLKKLAGRWKVIIRVVTQDGKPAPPNTFRPHEVVELQVGDDGKVKVVQGPARMKAFRVNDRAGSIDFELKGDDGADRRTRGHLEIKPEGKSGGDFEVRKPKKLNTKPVAGQPESTELVGGDDDGWMTDYAETFEVERG